MNAQLPPPETEETMQPGLSPPQFGTRELLLFVLVVALAIVGFQSLSPLVSFVLILLALAIVAHVAGNAIGTQLRDGVRETKAPQGTTRKAQDHHFAPTTQLSEKKPLGLMMRIFSGIGAIAGGIGGGWFLATQAGERATPANVTLAVLSCAVLGGLFGFWLSSFFKITIEAIWQAHHADD